MGPQFQLFCSGFAPLWVTHSINSDVARVVLWVGSYSELGNLGFTPNWYSDLLCEIIALFRHQIPSLGFLLSVILFKQGETIRHKPTAIYNKIAPKKQNTIIIINLSESIVWQSFWEIQGKSELKTYLGLLEKIEMAYYEHCNSFKWSKSGFRKQRRTHADFKCIRYGPGFWRNLLGDIKTKGQKFLKGKLGPQKSELWCILCFLASKSGEKQSKILLMKDNVHWQSVQNSQKAVVTILVISLLATAHGNWNQSI